MPSKFRSSTSLGVHSGPRVAEERGLVASPGSTGAAVITLAKSLEQPGAAPGGPVRTATA